MSWVAAATAAGGLLSGAAGGLGGSSEAPSSAATGPVGFGDFNFTAKRGSSAWPVVVVVAVVGFVVALLLWPSRKR